MTPSMIITLTVNPAIDVSTSVGKVVPIRKLRCTTARHDPGGGGINAARVIRRLGGDVLAVYTAGGPTGLLLRRLVEREGLRDVIVEVAQDTRQDFTVTEDESGQQYRFVLPGLPLSAAEWQACLDALSGHPEAPAFLVASGSLPPGVPADFYQQVARIAKKQNAKMVLDTAGPPLALALEERPYLIKPNLNELRQLAGRSLNDQSCWIDAGRSVIKKGGAELVALTLGDRGALLVTSEFAYRADTPKVEVVSTVGAGDSFLGGMVWSLAAGMSVPEAFRFGVAAGCAAVLNHGTELCHAADVMRLVDMVEIEQV
jgi:6-phosphofructokinase 2